jgi:hypothetical protein
MLDFFKKYKLSIIISLVLILLFAGTYFFVYSKYFKHNIEVEKSAVSSGNNGLPSNVENIPNAISVEERFNNCQKADDYKNDPSFGSDPIDFFYILTEALSENKEYICDYIGKKVDQEHAEICLTQYYRSRIVMGKEQESDNDYLNKLKNLGIDTLPEEAYVKNDISICDKVDDVVQKHLCRVSISLDQKDCVFDESEDIINTNACSESDNKKIQFGCDLSKERAESLCTNYFYGMMAIKNNDNSYCQKIDKNGYFNKLECLSILSENPSDEINKSYKENACYEKFAVDLAAEKNDISVCDKIPNKDSLNNKPIFEKCISLSK